VKENITVIFLKEFYTVLKGLL